MDINAFLAMAITNSNGTLNAVGIGLRAVPVEKLPAPVGPLAVGALIDVEDGELGNHSLRLSLTGPDGKQIPIGANGATTIENGMRVEQPGTVAANFGFGFPCALEGLHRLALQVDDRAEAVVPVHVVIGTQPEAETTSEGTDAAPGSSAYL